MDGDLLGLGAAAFFLTNERLYDTVYNTEKFLSEEGKHFSNFPLFCLPFRNVLRISSDAYPQLL